MKVRKLFNTDGTVAVIHPAPKSKKPWETEEQWLERVFIKANPNNLEYEDTDDSILPSRRFRDAWDRNGVNLNRAKDIVLKELRSVRNEELKQTDIEMLKLGDIGTPGDIIVQKEYRQKLRDLPTNIQPKLNLIIDADSLEKEFPEKTEIPGDQVEKEIYLRTKVSEYIEWIK